MCRHCDTEDLSEVSVQSIVLACRPCQLRRQDQVVERWVYMGQTSGKNEADTKEE